MLPWVLVLSLLVVPLPDLPSLPSGSEIRVASTDMRVVYLALRVEGDRLVAVGEPKSPPAGEQVAVVVRYRRKVFYYPGQVAPGDVVLFLPQGRASLRRILLEVYRLKLGEKAARLWEVWGGPGPDR